jgi:hypothetical protein
METSLTVREGSTTAEPQLSDNEVNKILLQRNSSGRVKPTCALVQAVENPSGFAAAGLETF